MILFKVWNNYFKYNPENGEFLSYGKSPGKSYSVGSWFKVREEEANRLRAVVLRGEYKVHNHIPGVEAKLTNLMGAGGLKNEL